MRKQENYLYKTIEVDVDCIGRGINRSGSGSNSRWNRRRRRMRRTTKMTMKMNRRRSSGGGGKEGSRGRSRGRGRGGRAAAEGSRGADPPAALCSASPACTPPTATPPPTPPPPTPPPCCWTPLSISSLNYYEYEREKSNKSLFFFLSFFWLLVGCLLALVDPYDFCYISWLALSYTCYDAIGGYFISCIISFCFVFLIILCAYITDLGWCFVSFLPKT